MSWTQDELDICQEAFYLLRQDVDVPPPAEADSDETLEWKKCKKAFVHAKAEVLAAHEWSWGRSVGEEVVKWPREIKNVLAYCTARELAIPLAGRIADMQNLDALYRDKLRSAIIRDLEDETVENQTAKEVLAAIRAYYSDDSRLPVSISKLVKKVAEVEDSSLAEILSAHVWENDVTGGYGIIYKLLSEV